ncbi:hypothetical protein [Candidatus Frankia alpina]|uniref:hypothetical protein n=1 Tax=Candidatus Frankia alpina TaxID=2699483 RepID=UPI001F226965|nr:hypothetical protein [Candidatus Frankia alpina]
MASTAAALSDAVPAKRPDVRRDQHGGQSSDGRRPEQHREHPADPCHHRRGQQGPPPGKGEHRRCPGTRGGAAGGGDEAERHQPVGDQVADVGPAHRPAVVRRHPAGDRLDVPDAVRRRQNAREQLGECDDLTVAPAGELDRPVQAGAGELAEQGQAVGPAWPGRHRARPAAGRTDRTGRGPAGCRRLRIIARLPDEGLAPTPRTRRWDGAGARGNVAHLGRPSQVDQ